MERKEGEVSLISKEKVIQRIRSQIALCQEVDSDWMSLTVETGKRILELIDQQEEKDDG